MRSLFWSNNLIEDNTKSQWSPPKQKAQTRCNSSRLIAPEAVVRLAKGHKEIGAWLKGRDFESQGRGPLPPNIPPPQTKKKKSQVNCELVNLLIGQCSCC